MTTTTPIDREREGGSIKGPGKDEEGPLHGVDEDTFAKPTQPQSPTQLQVSTRAEAEAQPQVQAEGQGKKKLPPLLPALPLSTPGSRRKVPFPLILPSSLPLPLPYPYPHPNPNSNPSHIVPPQINPSNHNLRSRRPLGDITRQKNLPGPPSTRTRGQRKSLARGSSRGKTDPLDQERELERERPSTTTTTTTTTEEDLEERDYRYHHHPGLEEKRIGPTPLPVPPPAGSSGFQNQPQTWDQYLPSLTSPYPHPHPHAHAERYLHQRRNTALDDWVLSVDSPDSCDSRGRREDTLSASRTWFKTADCTPVQTFPADRPSDQGRTTGSTLVSPLTASVSDQSQSVTRVEDFVTLPGSTEEEIEVKLERLSPRVGSGLKGGSSCSSSSFTTAHAHAHAQAGTLHSYAQTPVPSHTPTHTHTLTGFSRFPTTRFPTLADRASSHSFWQEHPLPPSKGLRPERRSEFDSHSVDTSHHHHQQGRLGSSWMSGMSMFAIRADPLLSDGVTFSPFTPPGRRGTIEPEIRWMDADAHATGHGQTSVDLQHEDVSGAGSSHSAASNASGSMASSGHELVQTDDTLSKGQRAGDPLSTYNVQGEGGGTENPLWEYEVGLNGLISGAEIEIAPSQQQHHHPESTHHPTDVNDRSKSTTDPQNHFDSPSHTTDDSIASYRARTMFAQQSQDAQQGLQYPSQSLGLMERPLSTSQSNAPSAVVPIGNGQQVQQQQQHQHQNSGQQYLVPVVQRGEHLFYDNEYPITSAASYTFGTNAHHPLSTGAHQGMDGHHTRQAYLGYGGVAGSRSAVDNLSHQNLIPHHMPRSFHGFSGNQTNDVPFTAPISDFPGSHGQLPSAMTGVFPTVPDHNSNGMIVPTHQIQPLRARDDENDNSQPPRSAYPQTPTGPRRNPNPNPYDHMHMLRSAAPEPEGPSAFMMAYQGGCTPQSVTQSRQPPSSTGRHDDNRLDVQEEYGETPEYEMERMRNIKANEQLMESLGLGSSPGGPPSRDSRSPSKFLKRKTSSMNVKAHPSDRKSRFKNRLPSIGPIRSSNRLASMSRTVSYADLDGRGREDSSDDESFSSGDMDAVDDDWGGSDGERGPRRKRMRSHRREYSSRYNSTMQGPYSRHGSHNPTLRDLVNDHPYVRDVFPLFYHIITVDLVINNNSFPLIGSVPSTCSPTEKASFLQQYYHKGRRCIAQLDAFTARCDKRYDGPGPRWTPLTAEMKIAIRDIRRKAVERCENYKYTRRDLLNKNVGKGKWAPIEDGWVPWSADSPSTDPANDLEGVVLLSPPIDSENGSQVSASSGRHRVASRKRSQAFSRKASRSDLSRGMPLRLQTSDVFAGGYSDERSHVGMGTPSQSSRQNQGEGAHGRQWPMTPQRQQVQGNAYHQTPTHHYAYGMAQATPITAMTPSIVRAARFASHHGLSSPFSPSAGGYNHSQESTPIANPNAYQQQATPQQMLQGSSLLPSTPDVKPFQQQSNDMASTGSQHLSMDDEMRLMSGGIDMDFNDMSEVSMQNVDPGTGFENQMYTG